MTRPYRDAAALCIAPADQPNAYLPSEAVVVRGVLHPGFTEEAPAPLVLLPGFDYRIRRVPGLENGPPVWLIDRRRVGELEVYHRPED